MSNRHTQHKHNKAVRTRHQRGVALITALLILALSTTAAVFLTNQHQLSIRRTGNVIIGNQAYLYALGGEALAMSFLHEDFKENPKFDALNEAWAMETVPLPVEGDAGAIYGKLTDLQGRFNINNLFMNGGIDPISLTRFGNLLAYFGLEPGLAYAVVDWIDPDTNAQGPYGAEDDFYVGLTPPYRAANAPMKSLSELRLIRGFAELENLDLLMQHLTVLPEYNTAINVNTASKEVLIAIGLAPLVAEGIAIQTGALAGPPAAAGTNANAGANAGAAAGTGNTASSNPLEAAMTQAASLQPFDTVAEFMSAANTASIPGFNSHGLDVSTRYFLYEGGAWLDRGRALLKSLLHRDNNGIMRVLMRSQGDL